MITRRMTYPVVGDPEWRDWLDLAPFALIPLGQCTTQALRVPPQCEAICFVHWYGVSRACAQAKE
jgi:hypothetical protein